MYLVNLMPFMKKTLSKEIMTKMRKTKGNIQSNAIIVYHYYEIFWEYYSEYFGNLN